MQCNSKQDVRGLLEASFGAEGLLLDSEALGEEFFDLSSGVAGELFQTFNNYGKKLALVVPDVTLYSQSFQQLALEHRNNSSIRFFTDHAQAQQWLGPNQGEQS